MDGFPTRNRGSVLAERRGEVAEEAPLVGDLDQGRPVAVEGLADGGEQVVVRDGFIDANLVLL
jgi:hypothetical protein